MAAEGLAKTERVAEKRVVRSMVMDVEWSGVERGRMREWMEAEMGRRRQRDKKASWSWDPF